MKNLYFYNTRKKKNKIICNWILQKNLTNPKKILLNSYNEDFKNLKISKKIHKSTFEYLLKYLNSYHKIDISNRSSMILLNRWCKFYIEAIIFRYNYCKIQILNNNFKTFNLCFYDEIDAPINLLDFHNLLKDENFNNIIIYKILLHFKNDKKYKINIKINKRKKIDHKITKQNFNLKFKSLLKNIFNLFASLFLKHNSPIIIGSYLTKKAEIKIKLLLGSLFDWDHYFDRKNAYIYKKLKKFRRRDKIFIYGNKKLNDIEKIISETFHISFPSIYLENFLKMKSFVKKNFPIKFPKFIFTANSFLYNEFFKFYTSEYITNKNSKYIVSQHGSKYGSILSQKNTYEEKSSDKFLTWGWRYNKNNIDLGVANTLGQPNLKITSIKKIILVFESKPVAKDYYDKFNNYLDRFDKILEFVENLKKKTQNKIILRFHHSDNFPKAFIKKIKLVNKNISIDDSKQNKYPLENSENLVIFFYYSSGFLELLSRNKPSLVFTTLNKTFYINKFYKRFIKLKNIIFFNNPSILAKKTEIYVNDVKRLRDNLIINNNFVNFKNYFAKKITSYDKLIKILNSD